MPLSFATLATPAGRLRVIGWFEAVSYLVLLGIAMPLKYVWGMPRAVSVPGMVHGVLFCLYVLAALQTWQEDEWHPKTLALSLVASVVPFGPFFFDRYLDKHEPGASDRDDEGAARTDETAPEP